MPSPFPGMDPHLESRMLWEDFHTTFLVALRAALKPLLPPEFAARLDERLYVVEGAWKETAREVFLEIRRVREPGGVVTVIELLSLANKENGRGREAYLRKQKDLLASAVNLLEIDFLRSGAHSVAPQEEALKQKYGVWDYLISLHRAQAEPGYHDFEVWPLTVRDRLPEVLVPLADGFPDVVVDLQAVFTRAYDEGPTESINYSQPPEPPLRPEDAKWAKDFMG